MLHKSLMQWQKHQGLLKFCVPRSSYDVLGLALHSVPSACLVFVLWGYIVTCKSQFEELIRVYILRTDVY
jgi:hypothetical protein